MNFKIEQIDRATIFRPKETRLDSLIAPDLKAEFLILSQPDVETLVLDLSEVDYIDSAGLSALLLARRQQVSHDGDIRIVGASDSVRSLLELTQLDRVFPIYPSIEEALAAPQLSSITVPASDVSPTTNALKKGMIMAGASIGAAAIADLMMSDGGNDDGFLLGGEEDVADDEEEDYDDDDEDDFDDDDEVIDEEEEDDDEPEIEDETPEEVEELEDPDEADIEEIEEDDLLEADDLDLDDDDEEDLF